MTPPPEVISEAFDTSLTGAPDVLARVAHEFAQAIRAEGNIRVVFGEPMSLNRHKIIPVARIEIGFGGGMGGSTSRNGNGNGVAKHIGTLAKIVRRGFGAGGGGGITVVPIGFIHEEGDHVSYRAISNGLDEPKRKHRS